MSAWTVIEHRELGSNTASITFSNIPNTFTDLLIVASLRTTLTPDPPSNWAEVTIRPNNNSSNLSRRTLFGTGSSAGSESASAWRIWASSNLTTSNTFGNAQIYIANYSGSTAKSASFDAITETNATAALQTLTAALWNNTTAISSLVIEAEGSANLMTGSSATLYGITRGSSGGVTVS